MLRGETGFHYVPNHRGLHDGSQVLRHRYRTPRRMAGQGKGRFRRAVAVVFFRHRESHGVQAVLRVAQTGSTIAAVHARFAHEHPTVFPHMEQSGEGVAVAILRRRVHRCVSLIFLLVTGLRPLPTYHGIALRRQESRGLAGETEPGGFVHHAHAARSALLGQEITESHVVVFHHEFHFHLLFLGIGQTHGKGIGLLVHPARLAALQVVTDVARAGLFFHPYQVAAEITDIGHQAQGRLLQHRHFLPPFFPVRIISYLIICTSVFQSYFEEGHTVGTGDGLFILLRCGSHSCRQRSSVRSTGGPSRPARRHHSG